MSVSKNEIYWYDENNKEYKPVNSEGRATKLAVQKVELYWYDKETKSYKPLVTDGKMPTSGGDGDIDTVKDDLLNTKNELTSNLETAKGELTTSLQTTKDELAGSLQTTKNELTTQIDKKVENSKMVEATTIFYVSTTGNDNNDGRSIHTTFATVQKAVDVISSSYLVIQSTIKISILAGTYKQAVNIPSNLQTKERLQILGRKDENGVPTVIFEGQGLNTSGIFAQGQSNLSVQDIKFQNYRNTGSTACGVHIQHFSNLWTNNVHVYNCDWGISASANSRLYVQGGIVDGCRFGIRHYSNSVGTIGYRATDTSNGTLIRNCTQAGVYFQNQSNGHVDYCVIDGNVTGVACVNQSRAHVMYCEIKNNTKEGVQIYHQSTWLNSHNIFTNNKQRWNLYSFSSELNDHLRSKSVLVSHMDVEQVIHNGTLDLKLLKQAPPILANSFIDKGRKIKVTARGTFTGEGSKNIQIRLTPSGVLHSVTSAISAVGSWKLEVELYAITDKSQKTHAVWIEGSISSSSAKSVFLAREYDFSIEQTIGLYGKINDATGGIIVETFEVEEVI